MTRLPILMYHNVSDDRNSKGLTIYSGKLEEQFRYLAEKGYTTYHFSELEHKSSIVSKSIIITFDDITINQLVYAVPLLQKYNLKATFFIPFAYIGKRDTWILGKEAIMSIEQLKGLDGSIELGLHSFAHAKYTNLSEEEINTDFSRCVEVIKNNELKVYNALAYPYGNYPKKGINKTKFINILQNNNVKIGLRIGNRVSKFPFNNPYEIKRIDIKGEDNLLRFKLKLRFGKLKLF